MHRRNVGEHAHPLAIPLFTLWKRSSRNMKWLMWKSGVGYAVVASVFTGRHTPSLPTLVAMYAAVDYTLYPIPKDRLDDVLRYLSGSTTGT